MTEPSTKSASKRVSRIIKVLRKAVCQAFLDWGTVASWLLLETMTGRVHTFGPRRAAPVDASVDSTDVRNRRLGTVIFNQEQIHRLWR